MPTLQEVVQKTDQFLFVVDSTIDGGFKSTTCNSTSGPNARTYIASKSANLSNCVDRTSAQQTTTSASLDQVSPHA